MDSPILAAKVHGIELGAGTWWSPSGVRKLPSGRTLGISMSPQLQSIFEALGQPTE